jgi:hypothetical protein
MKLLIGAWILGAAFVVWFGRLPSSYLVHVRQWPPPYPYPTSGVLWVLLFMAIQVVVLAIVVRPRTYNCSWMRAGLAFLLSTAFFMHAALGAMHAPPCFFAYIWWSLAVVAGSLLLLVWSASGAIRHRART